MRLEKFIMIDVLNLFVMVVKMKGLLNTVPSMGSYGANLADGSEYR